MRAPRSLFKPALEQAVVHALAHLKNLDQLPVCASAAVNELRTRLDRPLMEQGLDAVTVIYELVRDAATGSVGSAGGRFFGWVIGGSVTAALAADWLVSAWDQNAAIHACGPAVAVMEEIAGRWLKDLLGLPSHASFAFTTGSQLAHVTALAAARHALLARCGWDVERRGLAGAPPIRILSSNERHGSIERAVRLLGLGAESVIDLPVDSQGRLPVDTLASSRRNVAYPDDRDLASWRSAHRRLRLLQGTRSPCAPTPRVGARRWRVRAMGERES